MLNPTGANLGGKCGFVWGGTALFCMVAAFFFLPEMKGSVIDCAQSLGRLALTLSFTTTVEATERLTSCSVVISPHANSSRPRSISMPTSDRDVNDASATVWKGMNAIKKGVHLKVQCQGLSSETCPILPQTNCKDYCLIYVWIIGTFTIRFGQFRLQSIRDRATGRATFPTGSEAHRQSAGLTASS